MFWRSRVIANAPPRGRYAMANAANTKVRCQITALLTHLSLSMARCGATAFASTLTARVTNNTQIQYNRTYF